MNATSRFFSSLILVAAIAATAGATAPSLLAYQGRVKEAGLPVTGVRLVDIYLCPDAVVATAGCVDTGVQSVSVANGLFRTTFTAPSGVAWAGGSVYLQLEVTGQFFSPRELLASSAFAVYASSAATLVPNPGDTAVSIVGNVVLGGDFNVGASTLTVTGGQVGIGTASPSTALEVKGDVTLSGTSHVRASGAGVAIPSIVSGCGGGGSSIVGSDAVGRITIGGSATADCQIAFGTAWSPNSPVCHFTNESATVAAYAVSGLNSLSVTFKGLAPFNPGDTISYICLGY